MSNQIESRTPSATTQEATEPVDQEGIFIRVLPCCSNTLLQITVNMDARSVRFLHPDHGGRRPGLCTHDTWPGKRIQTVLKDGDRGMLIINGGKPSLPTVERTVSFLVLDLELTEIDNPDNLPLRVEGVF